MIAINNNFKHCHVYTTQFFSSQKLDLFIRALLLDHSLALEKLRARLAVRLAYILLTKIWSQRLKQINNLYHKAR